MLHNLASQTERFREVHHLPLEGLADRPSDRADDGPGCRVIRRDVLRGFVALALCL